MKFKSLILALGLMGSVYQAQAGACGHAMMEHAIAQHNLQQARSNPTSSPGEIAALQLHVARTRAMIDIQCHAQ